MIRRCGDKDLPVIYTIINEAAQAYKGVIPEDRWHEPYMPLQELQHEIDEGVRFWGYDWGYEADEELVGVMGIQGRGEVDLIRHAYVRTRCRNQGIGTRLLLHIEQMTTKPVLVGTWADASWAVGFYQKNGYRLLSRSETEQLLRKYWTIPQRQIETSVVLANPRWKEMDES